MLLPLPQWGNLIITQPFQTLCTGKVRAKWAEHASRLVEPREVMWMEKHCVGHLKNKRNNNMYSLKLFPSDSGFWYWLQEEGDQRDADDQQVQKVEPVPAEGALVEERSVDRHLSGAETRSVVWVKDPEKKRSRPHRRKQNLPSAESPPWKWRWKRSRRNQESTNTQVKATWWNISGSLGYIKFHVSKFFSSGPSMNSNENNPLKQQKNQLILCLK